jgi:hypothetical protein
MAFSVAASVVPSATTIVAAIATTSTAVRRFPLTLLVSFVREDTQSYFSLVTMRKLWGYSPGSTPQTFEW